MNSNNHVKPNLRLSCGKVEVLTIIPNENICKDDKCQLWLCCGFDSWVVWAKWMANILI